MITLGARRDNKHNGDTSEIILNISEDASISEMLTSFETILRGLGYHCEYDTLEINDVEE